MAKINMSMGILTVIFSGFLAYYFELEGALLALLLVQVLNFLFNFFLVKKSVKAFPKSLVKDKKFRNGIIQFSTPIALQEAVYSLTSWLGYLLLVNYASFGELGMYSAAMQWNAIVLFIPGILRNVILSHLSATASNDKKHGTILRQIIVVNIGATLVPFIGVLLFSSWITSFYGPTFQDLENVLTLAVFSTIAISVSNVFAQAYTSYGKNWIMLLFKISRDFLILGLFIYFVNSVGLDGAFSMILSQIVMAIFFLLVMAFYYYKFIIKDV
jgi:O-antigen/teichoic acid export membrane protein